MRTQLADSLGRLEDRRRDDRRALLVGLALSLGVHLALAGISLEAPSTASPPLAEMGDDPPEGLRVVSINPPRPAPVDLDPPPVEVVVFGLEVPLPSFTDPAPLEGGGGSTTASALLLRSRPLDGRLRWEGDPRPPREALANGRLADALAGDLARASRPGADSLSLNSWESGRMSVRPGVISVGGVSVPFCGGPDVERCGFGALPWDLEQADLWTEVRRGLEAQGRWETLRARSIELRRRPAADRDSIGGWSRRHPQGTDLGAVSGALPPSPPVNPPLFVA